MINLINICLELLQEAGPTVSRTCELLQTRPTHTRPERNQRTCEIYFLYLKLT